MANRARTGNAPGNDTPRRGIGFWSVVSIGVGGMVGGGIFAVLGLAVQLAHGGTPVAFAIAGVIALLTAYSYSRLSVAYPSRGGTVTFLDRVFGVGLWTGSLNVLLWLSYIVMLALYAFAFGSYGATFLPEAWQGPGKHVLITAVVLLLTGLNLLSANAIGRAEEWIVATKIAILLFFVVAGIRGVETTRLAPDTWSPTVQLLAGGMIIFLAYEGFELIANTAHDVRDGARILPRAYFTAVAFVVGLYVAIAIVTVGTLSVDQIVAAEDYALAEVARPFLGQGGFTLIAIAAMLSTASAINATLYGAGRLSFIISRDRELPASLQRQIRGLRNGDLPAGGLLVTAGLTVVAANLFDLSSIATLGSGGFLIVFAAVNLANARHSHPMRGAAWLSVVGAVACVVALAALLWQTGTTTPARMMVLVAMVAIAVAVEWGYRLASGGSKDRSGPAPSSDGTD